MPPRPNFGEQEKRKVSRFQSCSGSPELGRGGILLLALFCTGCAPRPAAIPKEAPNPKLKMTLEMTPRPVTSLDPTRLTVQVQDASGQAVSGATVRINLDMPAMPMGDNTITLRETRAGKYDGTGRFTMAGSWRVQATTTFGRERSVQDFPVEVR